MFPKPMGQQQSRLFLYIVGLYKEPRQIKRQLVVVSLLKLTEDRLLFFRFQFSAMSRKAEAEVQCPFVPSHVVRKSILATHIVS